MPLDLVKSGAHGHAASSPAVIRDKASHGSDVQDILPALLDKVGIGKDKFFVEFGYNKGSWQDGANTGLLANIAAQRKEPAWAGLLLDIKHHNPNIHLYREFISSATIVPIFQKYNVPPEPAYVSIDIDSADVWVLDAMLSAYKPRILTVEFNCNYEPGAGFGTPAFPDAARMPHRYGAQYGSAFHWGRGGLGTVCFFGSSSRAVRRAGEMHGYSVVDVACTVPRGAVAALSKVPFCTDLFLVRTDLVTWSIDKEALSRKLKPTNLHHPMSLEMASNLVDFETYKTTNSVCRAREVAARHLRKYARTTNHTCFSLLSELRADPACVDNATAT